jgi:hypothetical protein
LQLLLQTDTDEVEEPEMNEILQVFAKCSLSHVAQKRSAETQSIIAKLVGVVEMDSSATESLLERLKNDSKGNT